MPWLARAHTLGVSAASFEIQAGGRVEARLTFATAEPLGGIRLDRDHDGKVDSADLAKAEGDLGRFVLEGIDVLADGAACPATFEGAAIDEVDGLVLRAAYRCPDDASKIGVTLYYLSALPPRHREVARIVAGDRTAQAILAGDDRALELTLPPRPRTRGWVLPLAVGLLVAAGLALAVRRPRRTNRVPKERF